MQGGNLTGCINHAKNASSIMLPDGYLFFAHLLLLRAYASEGNIVNLQKEYIRCLQLKTDLHIGWICLKLMESRYEVQTDLDMLELSFRECPTELMNSRNMWGAIFSLVKGLICIWNQDIVSAEEFLAQACSLAGAECSLLLCHGMCPLVDGIFGVLSFLFPLVGPTDH